MLRNSLTWSLQDQYSAISSHILSVSCLKLPLPAAEIEHFPYRVRTVPASSAKRKKKSSFCSFTPLCYAGMNLFEATESSCLGTWAGWKVAQLDPTASPKNPKVFQQVQTPNQLTQADECLIQHVPSVWSFSLYLVCRDFLLTSHPLAHCSVLSFIQCCFDFFSPIKLLIWGRGRRRNLFFFASDRSGFFVVA